MITSIPILLDPKNDYVFKRLFTQAPELLVSLINAVRADEPPITAVTILNPRIEPEELTGKFIILDVLAEDAEGRQYNVEMQVRSYPAWGARSVYYLASLLGAQLKSGADYTALRPVIGIYLLDFDYFKAPEHQTQALWCFELRDRQRPVVLIGQELQLNLVELPKADRLGLDVDARAALAAWVTLLERGASHVRNRLPPGATGLGHSQTPQRRRRGAPLGPGASACVDQ